MLRKVLYLVWLSILGLIATGCVELLLIGEDERGTEVKASPTPTTTIPVVKATITKPKKDETVGRLMTVEGYVKDKDKSTYVLTIDSGVVVSPSPIADASFKNDVTIQINNQDVTVDTFSVLIDMDGLLNGEHDLRLEGLDDSAVPVTFILDKTSLPGRPEITDIIGGVKVSDVPPLEVAASGALTFIGKTVEQNIDVQIYSGVGSSNPVLVASGTSTNFSFSIPVTSLGSASGEENEYTVAARSVNALGNFSDSQAAKIFWDTKNPESTIALAATETDITNWQVNRGAVVSLEVTVTDMFASRFDPPKDLGKVEMLAGTAVLGTATVSDDNPSVFTFEWDTATVTVGVQSITARVTDLVGQVSCIC